MRLLTCALRTLAGAILALALVAACAPDLDKVYLVKDLRILALQAEPPEILFDREPAAAFDPVRISALAADPRAPNAAVDWELWGCDAQKTHCGLAGYKVKLTSGRTAPSDIRYDLATPLSLYEAAQQADPFKGFGGTAVMVELRILDQNKQLLDRAVKRVVYSQFGLFTGIPLGKVANKNPRITAVKAADTTELEAGGDVRWVVYAPGQVVQARANRELTLLPRVSDPEDYVVAVLTNPFETRSLEEYHSNHYFTTTGEMSHGMTGGMPQKVVVNKKETEISSEWTPAAAGPATLWFLVRDNRGGAGWLKLDAYVSATTDGGPEGGPDAGAPAEAGGDGP